MQFYPLPPKLKPKILIRRTHLPLKPDSTILVGRYVRLEPLSVERDAKPLFEMSNGSSVRLGERSIDAYDADELIWRYMFDGPFETLDQYRASLQRQVDLPNTLCFCVVDLASGRQIGVTNFLNNDPQNLKIEVGGIWYSPVVQRTYANTEATYLMLKHAFGLGYRRVEWKCNALNERSRQAALRLGFKFEGIQESHMIVKDRNRDTAWFRLLAAEWPHVKAEFEERLIAES